MDAHGDAINLLNIASGKTINNAPVKGQCAKDYMYGKDLQLEKAFQKVEGEYARVVRAVQESPTSIASKDFDALRFFAAMQYFRTESAMQRTLAAHVGMEDAVFDRESPVQTDLRPPPSDDREIMQSTMRIAIQSSRIFRDLKACIVLNDTRIDFVTSDDPAVFTSKYYFQRLRSGNFGVGSSGALLILPITPRALAMFYDGNVYILPGKAHNCVKVSKEQDIAAFNELQYLKSARNIYFSNYTDAARIKAEFDQVKASRPTSWFSINVFVQDESAPVGEERYRRASDQERRTASSSLVGLSTIFPEPSRWPSPIKYRTNPRTYNNGSAVGHVRKAEWLTGSGFDRELGRAT